mmetsp:Transcript_11038/g.27906  ORF Transcript_11038/g.27906 Transcript_11038/m.27906 type:complete len:80 (+) Transcript_11038:1490-1729(+)
MTRASPVSNLALSGYWILVTAKHWLMTKHHLLRYRMDVDESEMEMERPRWPSVPRSQSSGVPSCVAVQQVGRPKRVGSP